MREAEVSEGGEETGRERKKRGDARDGGGDADGVGVGSELAEFA